MLSGGQVSAPMDTKRDAVIPSPLFLVPTAILVGLAAALRGSRAILSAETRFSGLETVAFQRHSEIFHTLALRVGTAEMRVRTVVVRRVVAQPCRVVLGS